MSGRPVYVPSRKRKTKQQRFHGAFTGGFSAGYFNTVGSAEGWTPRHDNQLEDEVAKDDAPVMRKTDNNVPGKPKSSIVQRREDFMDEQDHNEWGGPTGVKKEFDQSSPVRRTADPLLDLVSPPSENLGHRLLRALGWRDGSTTAYVADDGTDEPTTSGGVMGNSAKALLSKRRLKKITLQQNRVQIPPPKQDTCGVGYQTYHDAPEFQRDRVRRQRLAQERAKAVTASQASNRHVYRVANVLGEGSDDDVGERSGRPGGDANHRHETTEHDGMTSYETVQDFVGTKTVGGFALREDDDDVYDDHHTQNVAKVNLEEYDTVLYDNHDSDVDDNDDRAGNGSIPTKSAELGTVLESWATSGSSMVSNDASSRRGRTSDGRPPLTGFVMGGTTASSKEPGRTRFPGPDMPLNYEVKRHVFRPDEPTGGINFEARDEQFQKMENRRKMAAAERRARAQELNNERTSRSKPMASAAFAGLAAAMKDRFTASEPESVEGNSSEVVGLQRLRPTITSKTIDAVAAVPENKELKSVRSIMTFAPESLLCKRLHVTAPSNSKFSASSAKALPSSSEASFFELEVLSSARKSQPEGDKEDQQVGRVDLTERPSMALLTSIFDADMEFEDGSPEEVMEDRQPTPPEPIVSEVNEPWLGHETGGVDDERSFASNAKIHDKTRDGQGEMKRRIDMIRSPSDAESSTKYGRMRSLRRTASSSEDDSVPATEHKRRGRRTREKKKRKTRHKSVRTGSKRH